MSHYHYHEIEAANPAECGHALGKLFGPIIRDYIEHGRECKSWRDCKARAKVLLSLTARHFPSYIDELSAYAAGAGVELLDLWTISIEDELVHRAEEKCTTVVTNSGLLIAHNEDWSEDAVEDICILKKRTGTTTTLELYYYGCPLGGTALSICSNGYVQAVNSLSPSHWCTGVPKTILARRFSEIKNVHAESSAILSIPRSSGFAHNLVARSGDLTVIECNARRHAIYCPEIPFVHTNHALHAELVSHDTVRHGTLRRYQAAKRAVEPLMNRGSLLRLMGDTSCGRGTSIFNENTIAQAVVDLERRVASFWLKREREKGWIDYSIDFLFETGEP